MLPEGDYIPYGRSSGEAGLFKAVGACLVVIVVLYAAAAGLISTGFVPLQVLGGIAVVAALVATLFTFGLISASGGDAGYYGDEEV